MELMITLIVVLIIVLMLRLYLVQRDVKKLQKEIDFLNNLHRPRKVKMQNNYIKNRTDRLNPNTNV